MLLPSAGAFVDPLFSTGIPLTLLGIERLGRAFENAWGTPELDARVAEGSALSAREVEAAARLVGASYAGFRDFPQFAALSMFYFAAASHSEMARRIGEQVIPTPPLFLRVDHPTFGPAFERLSENLLAGCAGPPGDYSAAVRAAVEPLNVAGLCDPGKRNWYPVELRDLIENAAKLGMSARAMEAWIEAAGWTALCLPPE
jgi:FADH2 O2-dependent halogenase